MEPLAEQTTDIAARLREIEEERRKERQAAALPDVPPSSEIETIEIDLGRVLTCRLAVSFEKAAQILPFHR